MAATRRLAAIMFTDMVGSTASAQANESQALKLRDEQASLVRPLFADHQGREIKSMGDGFLAESDSALRAVQCAIDIQQQLYERNSKPGIPPIQLRIGVHLGDVEQRENDIFGDAVNIASRIEPLAPPGGVCISAEVFSQVRNKIPNKFEKLHPTALKGLQVPMDTYRVVLPWTVREPPSAGSGPTRLAVLPFANISPDPRDEYFADGLTEELITVLSHLRELRVIARTSVMPYKSTSKGISQIGVELGVDAVLEGSVRKAGDELRITVQLIDVGTQEHSWANTYDRKLERVFAVQAEIAKQVAEALKVELRPTEAARLEAKSAVRPESYLAYLKGRTLLHATSKASLESAKEQFELAISLDPTNAAAHSGLADATRLAGWYLPGVQRARWDESNRSATRAIELDPGLAEAHASLAIILWDDFGYVAAEKEFNLAISLNPSYSMAHHWYAALLEDDGRADEALQELRLAEAADPLWSLNLRSLATLLIWLGRLDEAFVKIQKAGELGSSDWSYHGLLVDYYFARTDLERCLQEFLRAEALLPNPRMKRGWHAYYYARSGEKEESRALLRQEEALPESPWPPWAYALVYGELGDLDDCFRWLENAVERHQLPLQKFRLDPRYKQVRSDPRFQALLKRMNLA